MEDNDQMRVTMEAAEGSRVIHVEGELSLMTAGRLQAVLLEELQPGAKTVLDAAGITSVDIAGLQLICSAHRSYLSQEAEFGLAGMAEMFRDTARAAGFDACRRVCSLRRPSHCLWRWE